MITIEQLKEQERLAYINGDYEKADLLASMIEDRYEIQDLQGQVYDLEEEVFYAVR
jgi:hypothetical protein